MCHMESQESRGVQAEQLLGTLVKDAAEIFPVKGSRDQHLLSADWLTTTLVSGSVEQVLRSFCQACRWEKVRQASRLAFL